MERERCETCRFWDSSTQAVMAQPDTTGLCRIRPPVADDRSARAVWPFTADSDWCGQYSADPERVEALF